MITSFKNSIILPCCPKNNFARVLSLAKFSCLEGLLILDSKLIGLTPNKLTWKDVVDNEFQLLRL